MLMIIFQSIGHLFFILLFFFLYKQFKKWYPNRIVVEIACIGMIVIEAGFMIIEIYAFIADWPEPPITEYIGGSWLLLWGSFVAELFGATYLIQGSYQSFFRKKGSDVRLWELFAILRLNAIFISAFMFGITMLFDEISPSNPTTFFNTPYVAHGYILYRPGYIYGLATFLFLIFVGIAILSYIVEVLVRRFVAR